MAALIPTSFTGEVVWIGIVKDRAAALASTPLERVEVGFGGIAGEDHGGLTRLSCSRVIAQHPRGTEIRNTRQFAVISQEELSAIAEAIDFPDLSPAHLGASLMVRGIPDFTHLPPSSRLQAPSGMTLIVDMENRPCHLPAPVIDVDAPGKGRGFKLAGKGRRGITASVEREGLLSLGDRMTLHVPDQRAWDYLAEVRPV